MRSLPAQWHLLIVVAGIFLEVIISLPFRWSFVRRQFTLSAAYCMGGTGVKLGAGLSAIPQGMPRLGQWADWEQAQRCMELGGNRNWVFGGGKGLTA
jgi:hypothetical protein